VPRGNVLFLRQIITDRSRRRSAAVDNIGIHNTSNDDEGAVAVHSRKGEDTTRTEFIRITEKIDETEI